MSACACTGRCRMPPYTCAGAPLPTVWHGVIPPTADQHVGNYQFTPLPTGCICPPGANRDCENPNCPRKNHLNPKE